MTEIERNSLNLNEVKFVQIYSYRNVWVVGFEPSILCLYVECSVTVQHILYSGNTKGGSITIPLTSCLTGLDKSVLQIKTKLVSCHTADSETVKQEVNGTVILPPLVFPDVLMNTHSVTL
jgi:hypothetical protein